MRDDAWFAGFTDGEGCFQIRCCEGGYRYVPRFSIGLRADDGPVLEVLNKAFGGRMTYNGRRDSPWGAREGIAPQWRWEVVAKRDLVGLVAYFDRFPLRAKKASDFAIWRRAVHVYCASGGRAAELAGLHAAMAAGRVFQADVADLVEPFAVQLALGME